MPLRLYTLESASTFPPNHALALMGMPPHVRQGRVVVAAESKAAAAAALNGTRWGIAGPRALRLAMGNDIDTVAVAGLLSESGTVLVWASQVGTGAPIVRVLDSERAAVVATLSHGKGIGRYWVDVIPAGVE